jgi:hypothetical protein
MPTSAVYPCWTIGTPDETTPQANAHIGGNHVIGFKSSSTADGAGYDAADPVEIRPLDSAVTRSSPSLRQRYGPGHNWLLGGGVRRRIVRNSVLGCYGLRNRSRWTSRVPVETWRIGLPNSATGFSAVTNASTFSYVSARPASPHNDRPADSVRSAYST